MPALAANPILNPEAYDVVHFAGVSTAGCGVAQVTGAPRKYRLDVKDVAGAQGQTTTYQGWGATKGIQVKLLMWLPEHFAYFYSQIQPLVSIDASKTTPTQVQVYHPSLQVQGITQLLTEEVGQLTKEGQNGLWSVTLQFTEWRPAPRKNVASTPSGSGKSGTPAKEAAKPDVNAKIRAARDAALAMARRPT